MTYPYPLVEPPHSEEHLHVASVPDIACMKLSAITGRATMKDYVDLFFILKRYTLSELLRYAKKKFTHTDPILFLKSVAYTDDIEPEPIAYTPGNDTPFDEVVASLKRHVRAYYARELAREG